MDKKEGGTSVFRRLYILFGICMAVIYVSITIIFLKYAQSQREWELNELQSSVLHNASILEQQLDIIYNLEQSLIADSQAAALAYDETLNAYERSQAVKALVSQIKGLRSMNGIIEDIVILFPEQKMSLSALNGYGHQDYLPLEHSGGTSAAHLVYGDGKAHMEMLYPLTYSTEDGYVPEYGVRVTISEDFLVTLLAVFEGKEKAGAFCSLGGMFLTGSAWLEEEAFGAWCSAWEEKAGGDEFLGKIDSSGESLLGISKELSKYGITMTACRSENSLQQAMMSPLLIMGFLLLVISALFLTILYHTNRSVNKPVRELVSAFGEVQEGKLDIQIYHKPRDEFGSLYASFNQMVERLQELIENVKEQGRLLQNAELMQLQSQINPHFLYNSFYLIRIMAKNESYEQITEFVTSLAKYYRFLNKEVEQNIPLEREAEHMENYIDIQQMRFGDKITVDKGQMPKEVSGFLVPKLILQPIVENAYNYGMKDILSEGKIRISYRMEENRLFIDIEDNGGGGSAENLERMRADIQDYQGRAAGHALSNIERRLKLAYGDTCGILLEKSSLGGLKVSLKLDLGRSI